MSASDNPHSYVVDWNGFFNEHKSYRVETYYYESRNNFTLEDLYQAFKARMEHEQAMDRSTGDNP